MQIARIYSPQKLSVDADIKLSVDASRHLLRVLRHRPGDLVIIFNGEGGEYHGELLVVENNSAVIRLRQYVDVNRESPLAIHLVQGVSRGERMDMVVQKATELGVASITPLFTKRCTVKLSGSRLEKRIEHWQAVAVSACEQSGRCRIPKIHPAKRLEVLVSNYLGTGYLCDTETKEGFREHNVQDDVVTLLIGPEGGFSHEEIRVAIEYGFQSLSLGPRILRTETAPIVAMTLLQTRFGDL